MTLTVYHTIIYFGRWKFLEERTFLNFTVFIAFLSAFTFINSEWALHFFGDNDRLKFLLEGIILFLIYIAVQIYLKSVLTVRGNGILNNVLWIIGVLTFLYFFVIILFFWNRLPPGDDRHIYFAPTVFIYGGLMAVSLLPSLVLTIARKLYVDLSGLFIVCGIGLFLLFVSVGKILMVLDVVHLNFIPLMGLVGVFLATAHILRFNKEHAAVADLLLKLETKVVEREEELHLAKGELKRIHRKKTEMYSSLAHEIRTPLTLIRYYLEKSRPARTLPAEWNGVWNNILKLQDDMMTYLDLEKIQNGGKLVLETSAADLGDLCCLAAEYYNQSANDRNPPLVECRSAGSIGAFVDPAAFRRILNYLITEALKEGCQKVVLQLLDTENQAAVEITSFYHENDVLGTERLLSRQNDVLFAVIRELLSQSGGILETGTDCLGHPCERLLFPSAKSDSARGDSLCRDRPQYGFPYGNSSSVVLSGPSADMQKQTVLLVEDDRGLLSVLENELAGNYKVLTATGGKEALNLLKQGDLPDIVVSDYCMENGDGLFLLKEMKKEPLLDSVPFLLMSSITGRNEKAEIFAEGVVSYLPKPFSVQELKIRIKALLKLQQRRQLNLLGSVIGRLTEEYRNISGESPTDRQLSLPDRFRDFQLSEREMEVVELVSRGLSHGEIGKRIGLAKRTVTRHLQNIYEKVNVHNKVELLNKLRSP